MIAEPSGVIDFVVPVVEWPLAIIITLVAGFGFFLLARRFWITDRFDTVMFSCFSFLAAGAAFLFSSMLPYAIQIDESVTNALRDEFDSAESIIHENDVVTADVTIDGEPYSIVATSSTDSGTITYYIIEEQP